MHSCFSTLLWLYIVCVCVSSTKDAQADRTEATSNQSFIEGDGQATNSSQIQCGGDIFENASGTLRFPDGSGNYSNNLTCEWWIHVPLSKNIKIWLTLLDIPNYPPECSNGDHVTLYDGYKHGVFIGKFCGKNISTVFRSHSSVVGVEFQSDGENAGLGFILQFVAIQKNISNGNPLARGVNEADVRGESDNSFMTPTLENKTTRNTREVNTKDNPLPMFMSISLSRAITSKKTNLEKESDPTTGSYVEELTTKPAVEQSVTDSLPNLDSLLPTKYYTEVHYNPYEHFRTTTYELFTPESTTSEAVKLGTIRHQNKSNITIKPFLNVPTTVQGILLCDLLEKTLSSTLRNLRIFQEVGILVSQHQAGYDIIQLAAQADKAVQRVLSDILEEQNYLDNSECLENVSATYNAKLNEFRKIFDLAPIPTQSNEPLTTDANITDKRTTTDTYPDQVPDIGIDDIFEFLNEEDLVTLCLELNTSLTETKESLQILQELKNFLSIDETPVREDAFQLYLSNVKESLFNLIAQFHLFENIFSNDTCLNEIEELLSKTLDLTYEIDDFGSNEFSQREKFVCSTELTAVNSVIYSPGYPRAYPNNLACEWFISVRPAKLIAMKFINFKIDSVPQITGCDRSYDYIEVMYWLHKMVRKVDVYCGLIPPPVIVSLSNQMSIILRTNDIITNDGFIAVYTEVDRYPIPDPSNIAFPIELADAFLPPTVRSATSESENDAFLVLQAGGPCIKNLVETQGMFSSRELLRDPLPLRKCIWNILTEPWKTITLHLTFNLSPSKLDGTCDPSRAYILLVKNDSSLQGSPLCGNQAIQRISLGNSMKVVVNLNSETDVYFQAKYTTQDNPAIQSRFILPGVTKEIINENLPYDVIPSCGRIMKAREGSILSPNYPAEYTTNINCLWSILANRDEYIILLFEDFDLDSISVSQICDDLYSKVIIHFYNGDGNIVSRGFCGKRLPVVIVSKGNQMTITFKSLNGYGRGFSAKYRTIPIRLFSTIYLGKGLEYFVEHGYSDEDLQSTTPGYNIHRRIIDSYVDNEDVSSDCSFRLTDTIGTFGSPVNQDGLYPHNLICIWNIIASSTSRISLHFTEFNLDGPRTVICDTKYSYVTVLRTNEFGTVEVGRYCGDEDLQTITSLGQLVIKFYSMNGIGTGFKARYISNDLTATNTMSSSCIFSRNGTGEVKFSSELFQQYQHSGVCIWNILSEPNHNLYLEFQYFRPDMTSEGSCEAIYSHIIVTYTDYIGREIDDVFCGMRPSVFISNSENIVLKLFNMNENTKFKANYSSVSMLLDDRRIVKPVDDTTEQLQTGPPCLFTLSKKEGEFNNLDQDNVHAECVWQISVDSQLVILLTFEETEVADCNELIVVDFQDKLPFEVDSCVIRENAFLSSSNYLEIKKLRSSNLKFKYTAVNPFADGFRMFRPLGQMVTNSVDRLTPRSTLTDQLQHEYTDDITTFSRKAQFRLSKLEPQTNTPQIENTDTKITTEFPCDMVLRSFNGSIKSPGYPHSYPSNMECGWSISVGDAGTIVIDFLDFDINHYSLPNECEPMYGHLDIISVPDSQILRRMCGPTSPMTFFTNSSDVKIVIFTQYGFGRGFHLLYYTTVTTNEFERENHPVTQSPLRKLMEPTAAVLQNNSKDANDSAMETGIQQRFLLKPPDSNLPTASPTPALATLHSGGEIIGDSTLTYQSRVFTDEPFKTGKPLTHKRVNVGNTLTYEFHNTTTKWKVGMRFLDMLPHPSRNSSKRNFAVPVFHATKNSTTLVATTETTTLNENHTTAMQTTSNNETTESTIPTTIHTTESEEKDNLLSKSETRLALYIAIGIAGIVALLFLVLVSVCTRHSRSIDIQAAHQEISQQPTYRTWASPPTRAPAEHERLV
ncbi:cubilin-like [Anneissia japonica]|uniref:cubilin-like n=1 Tax=Anneissia japonica TaxID=1529436 RepID=UPI0014259E5C|nr:cubilin-like [Anneissia japonica]